MLTTSIFYFLLISILIFSSVLFIRNSIRQIKTINKIKEYRKFTQFVTHAVQEIEDEKIKFELTNFIVHHLKRLHDPNYPDSKRDISKIINEIDLKEIKSELYIKWGRHIPSLIQQERERKINNLLGIN